MPDGGVPPAPFPPGLPDGLPDGVGMLMPAAVKHVWMAASCVLSIPPIPGCPVEAADAVPVAEPLEPEPQAVRPAAVDRARAAMVAAMRVRNMIIDVS
jgi:hypothetical protein